MADRHAGLTREAPREGVRPHAGPADPLLRHAPARRHHEPLHQRHRHAAPDDRPVAAQLVLIDRPIASSRVYLHHARTTRVWMCLVIVSGVACMMLRDQAARRHAPRRNFVRAAAASIGVVERPHRGDHGRPEGRQGILPRGATPRPTSTSVNEQLFDGRPAGQHVRQHPHAHHHEPGQPPLRARCPRGRRPTCPRSPEPLGLGHRR